MGAAYLRGPRCPEPPLTEELLARAMQRLRRPSWPATLPEVLADPLCAPLVRGLARSLQRQAAMRSVQGTAPRPTHHHAAPARQQRPAFDPKKAAANDRDD